MSNGGGGQRPPFPRMGRIDRSSRGSLDGKCTSLSQRTGHMEFTIIYLYTICVQPQSLISFYMGQVPCRHLAQTTHSKFLGLYSRLLSYKRKIRIQVIKCHTKTPKLVTQNLTVSWRNADIHARCKRMHHECVLGEGHRF